MVSNQFRLPNFSTHASIFLICAVLFASCSTSSHGSVPTPAPTQTAAPAANLTPTTAQTTPIPKPDGWCDSSEQIPNDFLIVGYLPEYRTLNPDWGNCLTDIIYFSAEPTANGELDTSRLNPATFGLLQNMKEKYGTRIHVAVGGWGRSEHFSTVVTNPEIRTVFANNLIRFAQENNLDGFDFDWEFPKTDADRNGYSALFSEVKAHNLMISVALAPANKLDPEIYRQTDRIHIMSYDHHPLHATLEQAMVDVHQFIEAGNPPEKLLLGIPFYGRQIIEPYTAMTYAEIMQQYSPDPQTDEVDGIFFNGIYTVQQKTRYARENDLGGIMIWELGQDSVEANSLLQAIYSAAIQNNPND
ncbi:MAG: hypothetical protein CVU39_14920 [Chloroflexi bacterium HGW-Chloroflexi-10]|nr:MAG: hypothetical protein CVU39_14920 [Chloroflexi bacterium HGW-Chloroflexi-10]